MPRRTAWPGTVQADPCDPHAAPRSTALTRASLVVGSTARRSRSAPPGGSLHLDLQEALPKDFVKVRHAGMYAASNVNTRLGQARELLVDEPALDDNDLIDLDAIIADAAPTPS